MPTDDQLAVLSEMSRELGYSAANISANLNHTQPERGWTPRKVSKIHRELHAAGLADFGHLVSEDDNLLRGRGYWLSNAGYAAQQAAIS